MATAPNVRIANDFFHDSIDLLQRYRLTVDHFDAIKSQRFKLFIDLRISAECILKAYAAYFLMRELDRELAISEVEKYGHKIGNLVTVLKDHIEPELLSKLQPFVEALDKLPIGLRYRLDGMDFREVNETFYYETVGSDTWLDGLSGVLKALSDSLDKRLQSHSRILSGAEMLEELKQPSHNKYAK